MIEVKIKSDDAGHKYVVPIERSEEWDSDFETCCENNDFREFDLKWAEYMRNPDELRLFIPRR